MPNMRSPLADLASLSIRPPGQHQVIASQRKAPRHMATQPRARPDHQAHALGRHGPTPLGPTTATAPPPGAPRRADLRVALLGSYMERRTAAGVQRANVQEARVFQPEGVPIGSV